MLSGEGGLHHHFTIYPLEPHRKTQEAEDLVAAALAKYPAAAIAVGNGTGGREIEAFFRSCAAARGIPVVMVNESGASVYSASETARREFPKQDIHRPRAVSIAAGSRIPSRK